MTGRNGRRPRPERAGLVNGRALLRDAFVQCLEYAGVAEKPGVAARWLDKRYSTVARWLAGTHRIDTESVIECPQLGRHFADCLALKRAAIIRKAQGSRG